MDVAENLYDYELEEFALFVHGYMQDAADPRKKDVIIAGNGEIRIGWHSQQTDSNSKKDAAMLISPLNLNEAIGAWAKKAEAVGILSSEVTERHWDYDEDSERHIDQDGSIRGFEWSIIIHKQYLELADLITRVCAGVSDAI